jgi:hypothetical protein
MGSGLQRNDAAWPINPLKLNDLKRRRAVNPLKFKIPSKDMREKPTNTPIVHSVYKLCMVSPTCFGITLPSSGSVLWMDVMCPVVWWVAI